MLLLIFNVSAKETSMSYGTETSAIISLGNLLFFSLKHFNELFEKKVNANFFFENQVFKNSLTPWNRVLLEKLTSKLCS